MTHADVVQSIRLVLDHTRLSRFAQATGFDEGVVPASIATWYLIEPLRVLMMGSGDGAALLGVDPRRMLLGEIDLSFESELRCGEAIDVSGQLVDRRVRNGRSVLTFRLSAHHEDGRTLAVATVTLLEN